MATGSHFGASTDQEKRPCAACLNTIGAQLLRLHFTNQESVNEKYQKQID